MRTSFAQPRVTGLKDLVLEYGKPTLEPDILHLMANAPAAIQSMTQTKLAAAREKTSECFPVEHFESKVLFSGPPSLKTNW